MNIQKKKKSLHKAKDDFCEYLHTLCSKFSIANTPGKNNEEVDRKVFTWRGSEIIEERAGFNLAG